jgi:hypothetical protein
MIEELGRILDGSGHGVVEVLSDIDLKGLGESTKNLSQNSECPGHDSYPAPSECESRTLPLCQPSWYHRFCYTGLQNKPYSSVGPCVRILRWYLDLNQVVDRYYRVNDLHI